MSLGAPFSGVAHAGAAEPVEYVRECDDVFGDGFFYIPGTDSCIHAETGEVRTPTSEGLRREDSHLAARVRALESNFCDECFAVIRPNGDPARG